MKTKILVFILAVMALVSCSGLTQVTVPQSNINFVGKDFETERFVEYTLTKSYFLGIGGMSAKARNTNIIKELMRKAELQPNETLAYISISKNFNTFLGIITTVDYRASGYVVRPIGEYGQDAKSNYTDVPYTGLFQGEDSVIQKYETRGGARLVRQLQKKINQAVGRDELLQVREEVSKAGKNNFIDSKSESNLIEQIDSKLINLND